MGSGPHRQRDQSDDARHLVIYMTGTHGEEWASKGVPNSVLLVKPFAPAQIVTAISQLLNASPLISPTEQARLCSWRTIHKARRLTVIRQAYLKAVARSPQILSCPPKQRKDHKGECDEKLAYAEREKDNGSLVNPEASLLR